LGVKKPRQGDGSPVFILTEARQLRKYVDLFERAECMYENENYENALSCFEKLYTLNPSNTNANYIACCYIGLKQFDQAEKLLVSLINTCHWETIYYNLARVYMAKERYEDAFEFLKEAIAINSRNDDCFFYLGVFFEKIKKYEKAIENYKQAVQLSENCEDISMYYNNIGLCYYKMNDYDNALRYYDLSLESDKNNEDTKFNMKLIMCSKGNKDNE